MLMLGLARSVVDLFHRDESLYGEALRRTLIGSTQDLSLRRRGSLASRCTPSRAGPSRTGRWKTSSARRIVNVSVTLLSSLWARRKKPEAFQGAEARWGGRAGVRFSRPQDLATRAFSVVRCPTSMSAMTAGLRMPPRDWTFRRSPSIPGLRRIEILGAQRQERHDRPRAGSLRPVLSSLPRMVRGGA